MCALCSLTSLCGQVLELEEAKGEWGFKALKQIMKLHFRLVRPHHSTPHHTTPHHTTPHHTTPHHTTPHHSTPLHTTPLHTTPHHTTPHHTTPHHSTPCHILSQCLVGCQGNYEAMVARYRQLLTYIKGAVTRNYSEKSINSILDYISTSSNVSARPPPLPHPLCHTPSPPTVQAPGGAVQHHPGDTAGDTQ